jgi:D-glycerate 3-kinase
MATVDAVVSHILKHLLTHDQPLFVAVQGPQGSGKTYLSAQLQNYLTSQPHNLRTALLSIDDLYLPHSKLVQLAQSQPSNPLWQGRGLPGTHDVELGVKILTALKNGAQETEIPRFDKCLHDGQGDRLPLDGSGIVINQPPQVDVIILEGWCVGFCPVTRSELQNRWDGVWKEERQKLGLVGDSLCSRIDVERTNNALASYGQLWNFFDIFIEVGITLGFNSIVPPISVSAIDKAGFL